jgi:hypothetical protein
MRLKIIIGLLVLIGVIVIVNSNLANMPCYPSCQLNELQIKEIINKKYPNTDVNLSLEGNCVLCSELGCRSLGVPCWKANITLNKTDIELIIGYWNYYRRYL